MLVTSTSKQIDESSKAKLALIFVMHQIIGVWVVIRSAPIITASVTNFLSLFGLRITRTDYWRVLVGTPYFPVQVGEGLILGWILGRHPRHRSMLWVGVLPCIYLAYAIIAIPTFNPALTTPALRGGVGQSRLAHYSSERSNRVSGAYNTRYPPPEHRKQFPSLSSNHDTS
jgi:hypothetical protein